MTFFKRALTLSAVRPDKANVDRRVTALIEKHLAHPSKTMIFMKGTPAAPKCGFSQLATRILAHHNVAYGSVDVLEDEDLRAGVKEWSEWPTIPQVYYKGELIGGADILRTLHEAGEIPSTFGLESVKE